MLSSAVVNEIASRYATALFELAQEQKCLDSVAKDLNQVATVLAESTDLRRMIRSPIIRRMDQHKAMTAILDKMKAGNMTRNFIGCVANNRRLFALKAMIRTYLEHLAEHRGEVTAHVTTAGKLTAKHLRAVETALEKTLDRKVAVSPSVDPDIMGGLVVRVGSRMMDSSVRTQLWKLGFAMRGV